MEAKKIANDGALTIELTKDEQAQVWRDLESLPSLSGGSLTLWRFLTFGEGA